jgi:MFS family permease
MLMDISSEMIHALLPIYLVTVLGTSTLTVGFIEGIAEATSMITKIFSGALSDWLGKRKALTAFGYGLAAFTKPIFPLATTVSWVVAARFIDRVLDRGHSGIPSPRADDFWRRGTATKGRHSAQASLALE